MAEQGAMARTVRKPTDGEARRGDKQHRQTDCGSTQTEQEDAGGCRDDRTYVSRAIGCRDLLRVHGHRLPGELHVVCAHLSVHVALCQPPFLYAFAAWRTRGRLPHVGCGIGHDGIKRHLRGSHRAIERDCMDSYRASCHLAFSFSPLLTGGVKDNKHFLGFTPRLRV